MTKNPSFIFDKMRRDSVEYDATINQWYQALRFGEIEEKDKAEFNSYIERMKWEFQKHKAVQNADWKWFDLGPIEDIQTLLRKETIIEAGVEFLPAPSTLVSFTATSTSNYTMYLFCSAVTSDVITIQEAALRTPNEDEDPLVMLDEMVRLERIGNVWEVSVINFPSITHPDFEAVTRIKQPYDSLIGTIVITFMKILECSNVRAEKEEFPKKVNKKREAKGNKKGFDRHILKIIPSKYITEYQELGGTHASPKLHFRRGHIRHCASGITVWVRDCMVGRQELGTVEKDYKIETQKTC